MKTFFKLMLMGSMVFALASCGKDNELSGSKSSSSSNDGGVTSAGENVKNYTDLKNTFTKMSMASGLKDKDVVYHMGPDYGMAVQEFDFDASLGFNYCIDLIFWESGDCEEYQAPVNSQLENILNSGEYKVIRQREKNEVDFDLATDIVNNMFDFDRTVFDRNAEIYKAMLRIDGRSTRAIKISKATITLDNGSTVKGDYVEYFYEDGTIDGYVLSTGFPLIANPIMNTQNYQVTGVLNFAGNKTIRSVSATGHDFQYDVRDNKWRATAIGPIQIQF